uniref:C3H1-type domain-containing protein n=2 Tax=Aegilops tauschii TaxID=37682 RepID=A0A453KQ99_AEGTS
MGPESIFKSRLCMSFLAGESCAFGGRCSFRPCQS